MASSFYSTVLTVNTSATGALGGNGTSGSKLAVQTDGISIDVNGSNQLELTGTPTIGAATGTSIVLSGDAKAATFHVGAAAGIDASITTGGLVGKTITVSKGLITGFA